MSFEAPALPHSLEGGPVRTALDTIDWRQRVFALYARVRDSAASSPQQAHAVWAEGRDELFATHPASPLLPADRAAFTGLPVAPYDPAWHFELELRPAEHEHRWDVETGTDGVVPFELLGRVDVPALGGLDVWRLASYGGGLFIPVKDRLAGVSGGTYGGGRYLIDTIKGAWLGEGAPEGVDASASASGAIVLDFNFAYNPSCAYDPAWACPLAPAGNTLAAEVPVGERYAG